MGIKIIEIIQNVLIVLLLLAVIIMLIVCSHEHTYECIVEKEANCIENGKKTYICKCGKKETEILTKLGHTDGEWITDKEPNCIEDGSKHLVCAVCNETIKTETLENLGGHHHKIISMENNGVIGSNVTYKCVDCSDTYEKTVDEIVVSVQHTGTTSITLNGYGAYSKTYTASASGGCGNYQYKFEIYVSSTANYPSSTLTKDFSDNNSYSIQYRGNENAISGYILQVTVKDDVGNQTVYRYEI